MMSKPHRPRGGRNRRPHPTFVVAVLVATLAGALLAGCSSHSGGSGAAADGGVDQVTLSADGEQKPKVNFRSPFSAKRTEQKTITAGTGEPVKAGQRVTINYIGVNGADGREFDTSWGRKPASFVVDPKANLPGLVKGITGARIGSRILISIPPADGYGTAGNPAAGIGPSDTLILVVDIISARDLLTRAMGTPQKPKPGLPTVTLDNRGSPTIKVPTQAPPATLSATALILGTGAPVTAGQTVIVQYTGVTWPGGRVFDTSWNKPTSARFQLTDALIGWREGLVGAPVGSQMLLVIPPSKGYGAEGKDEFSIRGTDTLVFVVDILDAA